MPPSGAGRGVKPPPHSKTLAPSSITSDYIDSLAVAPAGLCALEQLRDECRATGKYLEAQVAAERVEQAKQEFEQERMGVSADENFTHLKVASGEKALKCIVVSQMQHVHISTLTAVHSYSAGVQAASCLVQNSHQGVLMSCLWVISM